MRGSTITRRPTSISALPVRRTCQSRCGLNNSSHTSQQTKTTVLVFLQKSEYTEKSATDPNCPVAGKPPPSSSATENSSIVSHEYVSHNTGCKSHTVMGQKRQHPTSATLNLSFDDTPMYPEWTCVTSRGLNRLATLLLSPCRMCFYRELYSS